MKPYPTDLRERTLAAVDHQLGMSHETLRNWVRRAERDEGHRPGPTGDQVAEPKRLRAENAELRRANEILKTATVGSTRRCNGGGERIRRCAVPERLAGTGVAPSGDRVGFLLAADREVRLLRQVPAQQAVGRSCVCQATAGSSTGRAAGGRVAAWMRR